MADFCFIAAGQLGLPKAVQRHITLKIMLFCNGIAETIGGQPIPTGTLERSVCIIQGYERFVWYVNDPSGRDELERAFSRARDADDDCASNLTSHPLQAPHGMLQTTGFKMSPILLISERNITIYSNVSGAKWD